MLAKRTMTLNLTAAEMEALEGLARRKDLSKTAVIRQALRLYQLVDTRVAQGEKLFFEDELQRKKSELMVLG
ncbi:MAG: transcriptional regulator [Candidatus Rokubacteria bacterium RIFCSPLOWO2_12_FULL_71_22]|nr:MAG: transcriptional regulator [Candidatus Rokubacteria bacterium RIFCSPLOWO2_12_FULL_71_22]